MSIAVTVVVSVLAMLGANIVSTILVQAEARNRALLSALLSTLAWLLGLMVAFYVITALQGNDLALKIAVIIAASAANFAGTLAGVWVGERYVKDGPATRLARLEAWAYTRGYIYPPGSPKPPVTPVAPVEPTMPRRLR